MACGPTEQHVGEAPVQPGLAAHIVVPGVDGLLEDVGVVPAEAGDFLMQPLLRVGHEVVVAAIPELAPMREVTLDAHAGRFDHVLAEWLAVERWQLAMPVHDLGGVGSSHSKGFEARRVPAWRPRPREDDSRDLRDTALFSRSSEAAAGAYPQIGRHAFRTARPAVRFPMRRLRQVTAMAIVALTAASCAATMRVSSHVERGLDFRQYQTYDWGPADALPTGDPRLDRNPFFKDRLQGAVERELALKGLEPARSAGPDLLVHYHANISKRIDVNRADRAYGYCVSDDCPVGVIEYEAGTLVLDIIDTRTNRLIWRGWAQHSVEDMLSDPDAMASTIEKAVTLMLARLQRPL